jgi:hypothetical protein
MRHSGLAKASLIAVFLVTAPLRLVAVVPAATVVAASHGACNARDVATIEATLVRDYQSGYKIKGTASEIKSLIPGVETDGIHASTGVGGKGWFAAYYQRVGEEWIHVGGDSSFGAQPVGWEPVKQDPPLLYWDRRYKVWPVPTFTALQKLAGASGCKNPGYRPPMTP